MQIKGTLQADELVAAQWVHMRPRALFAYLGLAIVIGCLWALWSFFLGPPSPQAGWAGWLLLAAVVYILLMFFVYLPYRARRTYRQRKGIQRQLALSISDRGIYAENENGSATTPWGDFIKWKEGKSLFLLYLSDSSFLVVPKRFFSPETDTELFRKVLKDKVVSN